MTTNLDTAIACADSLQPVLDAIGGLVDCDNCDGKGWYATGEVDNAMQLQCRFCLGTGKTSTPANLKD